MSSDPKNSRRLELASGQPTEHSLGNQQALNLALQHHGAGDLSKAEGIYQQILKVDPNQPVALHLLGMIAHQMSKNDIAVELITKALAIKPDFPVAHNNLGNVFQNVGRLEDAAASYHKALAIDPDYAEAHNNLGLVFQTLGRLEDEDAVAVLLGRLEDKALAIKPNYAVAHNNLLFAFKLMAKKSSSEIKVEAEKFGQLVRARANPFKNWNTLRSPEKRLRVGIVSGDLRNHVVARFLESVLENFDKSRLEFVAYSNFPKEDKVTARLKPHFARWNMVVGLSDDRLASLIHEHAIDILIDLSGHSVHNRLPMFAFKPAPVQATWLGLFATTGVPGMDYIISDPHIAPPHEADHFTEEIWPLAETWFCATPPEVSIKPASLPAMENGYVTFGCFNNLAKMNDMVVELWAKVLHEVPGSRLFLKTVNDGLARGNTLARFATHGIGPEQLVLEGKSPPFEYYAAYNRIDIALDTFPYNGGMTTLDSLWMAVPVLTRRGERVASHLGESIAFNAGLADWIAHDDEDYVAKAVAYSSDLDQLAKLRNGLRKQVLASPLYDATRFARYFEEALRGMWHKACGDITESTKSAIDAQSTSSNRIFRGT